MGVRNFVIRTVERRWNPVPVIRCSVLLVKKNGEEETNNQKIDLTGESKTKETGDGSVERKRKMTTTTTKKKKKKKKKLLGYFVSD